MTLLIISFLAWILTILAPCVLPLLPIILWASATDTEDKYRPYIIISSLIISIVLFSLLLKASTVFIWVDPIVWKLFSWVILIAFWIITMFPNLWKNFSTKMWFADKSNKKLWDSAQKKWPLWAILVWISLWPVFSSCSPTYAVILAVILPVSFFVWVLNLFAYAIWLGLVLLIISLFWQKFISKAKWASSPNWIFKKILAIIFLVIWLAIITWYDKVVETAILDNWYFDITEIEQQILDKANIEQ
jgi:cytochrome c-type biogenesis protein